jgi:hypothetical protein
VNPLEEDEERWPDEPEEFDPDSLGPDVPDPTPDVEDTLTADAEVSEELFRAFWAAVLFLNVAIAALAVGAMLIYFRGDYARGGPALLVGTIAALSTARYYWGVRTGRFASDGDKGPGDEGGDDP